MVHLQLGSVRGSSLQSRRTASLLFAGLFALGIGTVGHHFVPSLAAPAELFAQSARPVVAEIAASAPVKAMANVAGEVQDLAESVVSATPEQSTREVELGKGRTFPRMLIDTDIDSDEAFAAAAALNKVYDFKKLKAGQEFTLSITRTGDDETLMGLTFAPEPTKEVTVTRQPSGDYVAELRNTPLERQRVAARGEIQNSLYRAGAKQGVPRAIMAALIRAFSHEVDFQRDIHPGDKFEVLYDQPTAKNGSPIGQGVIIYAALIVNGKANPLYRVTFGDGAVDYFNEHGQSIKRSLLRTPVEGAKITSGFGMRMHPLLGYSKMHKGVDFGAPVGTPIYAAGAGAIEQADFDGSYGRLVVLRHTSDVETAYAHMSRFAKGVYPGARVNQGDVIGYVGTSGRSTGAHLHFEVRVNKQAVNPLNVSMPIGRVLKGKTLDQFESGQTKIKQEFKNLLLSHDGQDSAEGQSLKSGKVSSIAPQNAVGAIKVAARQ